MINFNICKHGNIIKLAIYNIFCYFWVLVLIMLSNYIVICLELLIHYSFYRGSDWRRFDVFLVGVLPALSAAIFSVYILFKQFVKCVSLTIARKKYIELRGILGKDEVAELRNQAAELQHVKEELKDLQTRVGHVY